MDIQTISALSGLFMTGIVLLGAIIGGIYLIRSGVGKQASDAQQSALTAMQSELEILRGRVTDAEKENTRLQHIVDTIHAALEARGMIITIQGKMVYIKDGSGIATIQISGDKDKKDEDTV